MPDIKIKFKKFSIIPEKNFNAKFGRSLLMTNKIMQYEKY